MPINTTNIPLRNKRLGPLGLDVVSVGFCQVVEKGKGVDTETTYIPWIWLTISKGSSLRTNNSSRDKSIEHTSVEGGRDILSFYEMVSSIFA